MKYLLVLLLSGCSLLPPKIQEIKIPVPVSCIETTPSKPSLITDAELIKLDDGKFVTALHLDRLKRQNYEAELEAILSGCQFTPNGKTK
jgi:hypothetical protein